MISNEALLEELTAFSGRIRLAIDAEEWEALNKLLLQRQNFLEDFLGQIRDSQQNPSLIFALQSMQRDDEQFLAEIQSRKAVMQKEVAMLSQGRKHIKAYQIEFGGGSEE